MTMRIFAVTTWVAATAVLAACQTDALEIETFDAPLSGASEVPPRTTPALGAASFQAVGGRVSWTLEATGLTNVTAAHIHGPASLTETAGVIVTLLPSGPFDGTASGSFDDVDAGSSAVTTMEALLQLMRSGQAYVNVHTSDGVDPPNTGPGDFPGGEIRGQIRPR